MLSAIYWGKGFALIEMQKRPKSFGVKLLGEKIAVV
jgi:hypothetical protein